MVRGSESSLVELAIPDCPRCTRKQRLVGEDIGDSAYRSFPSTNHDVVG